LGEISLLDLLIGIKEIAMLESNFTSCSTPPEPFDVNELINMLEKAGEPQGLVLLPNGSGLDVYQFPVALLKGAISFMQGRWNPLNIAQQIK